MANAVDFKAGGAVKPCPECGSGNLQWVYGDVDVVRIRCRDCRMTGPWGTPTNYYDKDKEAQATKNAIEGWNAQGGKHEKKSN